MATILLSAAGAALGSGFGGTVLGLSGAVIGRAVGATLGRALDQRIAGSGSEPVAMGKVERFRLTGASEGAPIGRVWGRVRVAGQVIWATRFQENVTRSGGGKGAPKPKSAQFSYSVSLAIGLCEGEIRRVGRIWADGIEVAPQSLQMRLYTGDDTQLPDPKIAAVEGAGAAPAYRGIAYVVIEDLDLSAFGNRVPQFNFEVVRAAQPEGEVSIRDLAATVPGVCLIPGTGEYAYATTPVHYSAGLGQGRSANVNTASDKTDFAVSLNQLQEELPGVGSVSLVVSWFGNDLRCGSCSLHPKVEQKAQDGIGMPWRVAGLNRAAALEIPKVEGRSIYGGTPTDQSVIEAIVAAKAAGLEVTFYPFILMEQLAANTLPDPWTGLPGQPKLPWRGRITTSLAPGLAGSPDRSASATAEVTSFFGTATAAHFGHASGVVSYSGPVEWGYRRFVLHNAALCAAAGGVDAFCIGSEMRGLTQIRGAADSFPAVSALRALAGEVRSLLGPTCKLSYAADWSEYFGYHADGDVHFHLDPLWADPQIDFIGIDNYMPLSDWRDGESHADAAWGAVHNPDYLKANIAGAEGFDWYYDSPEGEAAQIRRPIEDGLEQEPWVFRYKDLKGWWNNLHHSRIGGVRSLAPTGWVPQSKPIRFTEFGCAAVDKGTNQPNRFLDPKSSESGLPKYSNGARDDLLQMAYFSAMAGHWADLANNPVSAIYAAPMLDYGRSLAWAWDVRPFPAFPANETLWSDGVNYDAGHWLNGRASNQPLEAVATEICEQANLAGVDARQAWGVVRGYAMAEVATARAFLQPLVMAASVDATEREGRLTFARRTGLHPTPLDPAFFALSDDIDGTSEATRLGDGDLQDHLRLIYIEAEANFAARAVEASTPDAKTDVVAQSDLPLSLTRAEAVAMAERWLVEARLARDTLRFALPRSQADLGAGHVVSVAGVRYRIDRSELSQMQMIEAVRIEPGVYRDPQVDRVASNWQPFVAPLPAYPLFLDLPLLTGSEVPHAPHIAIAATPWPGQMAVWAAPSDAGYLLNTLVDRPAAIGVTETDLPATQAARWDRGPALRVRFAAAQLSSAQEIAVLAGVNAMAIGDGSADNWEVLQFAEAELVAPGTFDIRLRLRGQLGTNATLPPVWPAGCQVVLLDGAPAQIDLPLSARGLARYYRINAATRGYDAAESVLVSQAFAGIGLRPYSVCHLRAKGVLGADVALTWIRRTRLDGDTWHSLEVPLGEETEAYQVSVYQGAALLRQIVATSPAWSYTAAMQTADGAPATPRVEVAQISASFGAGPVRSLALG